LRHALSVTLISLAMFAAFAIRVTGDETPWLDIRILRLVPAKNDPNWLSNVCNAFLEAGIVFGVITITVALLALIVRRKWRPALFWVSTFGGVAAFDLALKPILERPPIGALSNGYSFPSGNAMGSMALLVAVGTLVSGGHTRRLLFVVGSAVVIAYGAALVYISWHYPTDVVAGWLLSLAWVSFLGLTIRPCGVFDRTRPPGAPTP
jgi:membrane-associated phospholipid phosphatase